MNGADPTPFRTPRGTPARRLVRALRRDGFYLDRIRGSHHVYVHLDGRRVVVPYTRLSDTFPIGTLRGIIADAGWGNDDLRRLGLIR